MKHSAIFLAGLTLIGGSLLVPAVAVPKVSCELGSGDYIVTFKAGVNTSNELKNVNGQQVMPRQKFSKALNGFAGTLTSDEICALKMNTRVDKIEVEQIATIDQDQLNPPSWGLDRIDQTTSTLDKKYSFTAEGSNVTAYVIDTGIFVTNTDFGGRAKLGFDFSSTTPTKLDCNGHGTHVAGTIGGTQFGVAKKINLVAVRVLNCNGSGSYGDVIAGIDWIINSRGTNNSTKAVANMSLGGPTSEALDTAVKNLISNGVVVAVAAGNSNSNAINYSPSRVTEAITVGASDSKDNLASYSNFGQVVDLIAPGSNINSDWLNNKTKTLSGTSMATPHVAGVIALALSSGSTKDSFTGGNWPSKLTTNAVKVSSTKLGTTTNLLYKDTL